MSAPLTCHTCRRELFDGDMAWESDWKVLDTSGNGLARWERRYFCEECVEDQT